MKNLKLVFIFMLLIAKVSFSQTFVNNTAEAIGSWNATLTKVVNVSGLPTSLGSGNVELIQFDIHLGNPIDDTRNFSRYSITLTSPQGTTIIIAQSNPDIGGAANAFNAFSNCLAKEANVKFRDNQYLTYPRQSSGCAIAPWSIGFYRTMNSDVFSSFNGENPNGNWTVTIRENSTATGARFNSVKLHFKQPFYVNNLIGDNSNDNCNSPACIGSDQINYASNNGYTPQPSDPLNGVGNLPTQCPDFNAMRNNSAWFYFIADSTNVNITLSGITSSIQVLAIDNICSATGFNVLQGGCPSDPSNGNTSYSNGTANNIQLNMSNLTIGQMYYLVIDGTGGSISPFYIEVAGAVFCSNCNISPVASNNGPLCTGQSLNLSVTNTGTNFSWSGPNGFTSSLQHPVINNVNSSHAGMYYVTVTDSSGCIGHDSTLVVINANGTASATANSPCVGNNLELSASAGVSWTWSGPNGFSDTIQNPIINNVSNLQAGTYSVTVTTSSGCTATASISVTVNSPTAFVINSNSPVCVNNTLNFTTSGGSSWLWSGPNSFASTSQNPSIGNVSSVHAGTYYVSITDANSCVYRDSVIVSIIPRPVLSSVAADATCAPNSGSVVLTVTDTNPPYTFAWSNGSTAQNLSNVSAGSYSVTVSNQNSCTAVHTVTVGSANNNITMTPTITHVSCFGQTNGSISMVANGGSLPYTYSWSNGSTQSSISNLAAGSYTVTVTDALMCTSTSTLVINQPDVLTANALADSVSCYGFSNGRVEVIVNGGSDDYSFSWSNGATTSTVNNLVAGSYSVTVTDGNSCSSTASTVIYQPDSIVMQAIVTNASCSMPNGSISLNVSGGVPGYTYQWSHNAALSSSSANALPQGNYTVVVRDSRACSLSFSATINDSPPPVIQLVSNNSSSCSFNNGSIEINALGGTPPLAIQWSNGQTGNIAQNLLAGTYTVTVSDANSCSTSATYTLTNIPKPQISVVSKVDEHCSQSDGFIQIVVSPSNQYTYQWSPSVSNSTSASGLTEGNYKIIVSDALCSDTINVQLNNLPGPVAQFETNPSQSAKMPEAFFRFINQSQNETSWMWYFGDGQNSTIENPTHTYQESGTYQVVLIVTDHYGCSDTAYKTLNVIDQLQIWIPNAFTPESNGLNEVFKPKGSGYDPDNYSMQIFDRWGGMIFFSNRFEIGWDGTYKGKRIPDDLVFVYRIVIHDLFGKEYVFVGRVTKIGSNFNY